MSQHTLAAKPTSWHAPDEKELKLFKRSMENVYNLETRTRAGFRFFIFQDTMYYPDGYHYIVAGEMSGIAATYSEAVEKCDKYS